MDGSRTTVQKVYESARRKLACMLSQGRPLRIAGGDVCLCGGRGAGVCTKECLARSLRRRFENGKGANIMRVAVTYDTNGEIFQHFGRTELFKVYDIENGAIVSSEVVGTNGQGHGALAGVLSALKADVLICGGIGGGAQAALAAAGIRLCGGVMGSADDAAAAFAAGRLAFDPDVCCSHHGHHHEGGCGGHGEDHGCGHHHHEGECGSGEGHHCCH